MIKKIMKSEKIIQYRDYDEREYEFDVMSLILLLYKIRASFPIHAIRLWTHPIHIIRALSSIEFSDSKKKDILRMVFIFNSLRTFVCIG